MKVCLVNDTHLGARNESLVINNYFFKFWDNIFFPYLEEHKIKNVFHLGDFVDRRKFVNFVILNSWRTKFMQRLQNMDVHLDVLVGNHDVPYRNTNQINALEELFTGYKNVTVYPEPRELILGDLPILLLPWINTQNYTEAMKLIRTTKARVVFGHLAVNGFSMNRGYVCADGLERKVFDKFEMVLSGHFHHKSSDGQIFYLGNQYQIDWGDANDVRGFHVFDTETKSLEFIPNPYSIFNRVGYDDVGGTIRTFEDLQNTDFEPLRETYVKILVVNKKDPYLFDAFTQKITSVSPIDVTILEDTQELNPQLQEDEVVKESDDPLTFLGNFIDAAEIENTNKGKLKNLFRELYMEAVSLETV